MEGKASKAKFDILGNLPREITFKVLINLNTEDIESAIKCCKKWREDTNYELFWKLLYRREYVDFEPEPKTEFYRNMLRAFSIHWQGRYIYNRMFQYNIENNMRTTVPVRLLELSDELVYFDDDVLILVSNLNIRKRLVIINSSTGVAEKELLMPVEYVTIMKHENLVIVITKNFRLSVWNINSCRCTINVAMRYHPNILMWRLFACKHLIFITGSSYMNSFSYIFNMETQEFGYLGEDLCIFCNKKTIAVAAKNGVVHLSDTNLKSLVKFDCFKAKALIKIIANHDFLVKAYKDLSDVCYASVWNIKTKANFRIRINNYLKLYLNLAGNILLCQTAYNRCEVWDLHAQKCRFKIDTDHFIDGIAVLSDRYIFLYFHFLKIDVYHIQKGELIKTYLHRSGDSRIIASTKTKLLKRERPVLQWDWKWEILNFECLQG